MKLRSILITLLLIIISSSAFASTTVSAKKFISIRRQRAVNVSVSNLKSDPQDYIGKIFEIRGNLKGVIKSSGGDIIMICGKDGAFQIKTDKSPIENPGPELACLVKIGKGSVQSLSDLDLVACTYGVDLQRIEDNWQESAIRKDVARACRQRTASVAKSKKEISRGNASRFAQHFDMEDIVRAYRHAIKGFNSKLTDSEADKIARSIIGFSAKYKLDPRLVCAVILAESHFRIGATSRVGAQGLGQLMPSTAAGLGVDNAYDPVQNIYGSVRYIKGMLDRMTGHKDWNELTWNDIAITLAAYNAGPGAVKRHGGVPPYRETQNYVRRVTSIYKKLCGVK